MGKRQHQKDKMYLTYTEWTTLYGGKRSGTVEEDNNFKRLPFDHCCLSLVPFEDPYCDADGNIFELQPLLEFVKKFKVNPVTGKNVRGLKTKLPEWRNNMMLLKHSLLAATETFLDDSVEDSEVACGDWRVLRRDRGSPCGGVLLAARSPISLRRRQELETDCGEDLWASFVWHGRTIYVCVVYITNGTDEEYLRWFCKKLDIKSLIKLNFFKNAEGEYHCPVLFKLFTNNTHIAAIKTTGNVFSYEAVEQLNIKGKNYKDLVNDTPFARNDIIILQEPNKLQKFNIAMFHHVKNSLKVETEEDIAMRKDPHGRLKTVSTETKEILQELEKEYKAPEKEEVKKEVADKFNAAHYSTGKVAASFTSTAMVPETVHEAAIICEDEVKYERVKKKGYVRLLTNYGPLNLELYCDVTPKACDNFIRHCNSGYYNGTKFHRSIRNFMIQGGDPTGTGLGGESVWKKPFEDEVRPNLHHAGRGVLSMANSGPNTNGSQFFITFRSCKQLDGKHTIFGKLVGGMDTLTVMEQIGVDNKDRPIHDIVIEAAQVFVDPFAEAEEQLVKERTEELKRQAEEAGPGIKPKKASKQPLKVFRTGVGKYLNLQELTEKPAKAQEVPAKKSKKEGKYNFGGFDSW